MSWLGRASGVLAVAGVIGAGTTGIAAAAPPAGLSVTLTDNVQHLHSNQDVTYVAKLANVGDRKLIARLVVDLPAYASVRDGHGGRAGQHAVTWNLVVTAGTTVSKRVNVHVGQIARSDLRVTALASVYQKGSRSAVPLIRTADADRIDGVKDPVAGIARPAGAESSATSTSSESDIDWWLVAGLPAVLVLGAGAYGWQRRRSRVSAADVDTGDEPALAGAGTGERGER